jgi:hypothetical protein
MGVLTSLAYCVSKRHQLRTHTYPEEYCCTGWLIQLQKSLTEYVAEFSHVVQDRCGPGSRCRKCKIRVTIGLACDNGRMWRCPVADRCASFPSLFPLVLLCNLLIAKRCLLTTRAVAFYTSSEKLPVQKRHLLAIQGSVFTRRDIMAARHKCHECHHSRHAAVKTRSLLASNMVSFACDLGSGFHLSSSHGACTAHIGY